MVYKKLMEEIYKNCTKNKKNTKGFYKFIVDECGYFIPRSVSNDFSDLSKFLFNPCIQETYPTLVENKILHVFNGLSYLAESQMDYNTDCETVIYKNYLNIVKIDRYTIIFIEIKSDEFAPFGEFIKSKFSYEFQILSDDGEIFDIKQKFISTNRNEFIEKNSELIKIAIENNELILINKVKEEIKQLMNCNPVHAIILNFINPLNFDLDSVKLNEVIGKLNQILQYDDMECGQNNKGYPYLKSYKQNIIEMKFGHEIRKVNIHIIELEKIKFLFSKKPDIYEQIQKRIKEAEMAYGMNLYLSTLVMLGSVVEGICYTAVDILRGKGVKFKYFPKVNNEELEMSKISQYELIKILVEQGLFDAQLLDTMKVIKNFRNLIHPYHKDFSWPGVNLCDIAWNMLKIIIDKLKDHQAELMINQ